jgi:hypothetical protein
VTDNTWLSAAHAVGFETAERRRFQQQFLAEDQKSD